MIYTTTDLRTDLSRREIDSLVDIGQLIKAGRSFYATPSTDALVVAALRAGARPTCLTAAHHHKLWVPPGSGKHAYSHRSRDLPTGWIPHGWHQTWPEADPVASPGLLVQHAATCLDPVDVGILADSALHDGSLDPADLAAITRGAPRDAARVLARATKKAESGTETKVRLFFQLRGVPVQPQVEIPGVGRVDHLVGRRWIVECDSKEHHTGTAQYEYDRARDMAAAARGYTTNRLTYDMVFGTWTATTELLISIIRSGQHLVDPARWLRGHRS